ncbi:MAG: hypothetical protein V1909_03160 [Candidatus Micrarchaeota archaeon]
MGKCAVCKEETTLKIAHAGVWFCKEHFLHYVKKKVKLGARELGIFDKKRNLGILMTGDSGSAVALAVMREIAKERGTEIVEINAKEKELTPNEIARIAKKNKVKLVITGHSIEDFVLEMLLLCSMKKPKKLLGLNPKKGIWGEVLGVSFPSPLFRLYRSELEEYAKLCKLSHEPFKQKINLALELSSFVEKMEKKHPGTKHKMLKSLLYFSGTDFTAPG